MVVDNRVQQVLAASEAPITYTQSVSLSRPCLILRIGDGRVELDRQNTFPVKDSLLKPLGFNWDTERRIWWKAVGDNGAAKVRRELQRGLLDCSMTLKLEKLIDPEIQTLRDEVDELDGYLSESEDFDDDK